MFSPNSMLLNLLRQSSITKLIMIAVCFIGSFIGGPAYGQLDVWIDPGHGGNDPGALGIDGASLPNEKELNIGVAYYLENDLTGLGYFAYRTQNYDTTYYQPSQRREIANGERPNDQGIQLPCRLLVSIHMNSSTNSAAMGTETYYTTIKYDAKKKNAYLADKSAAEEIHADLMTYANVAFLFCSSDRGIKPANFAILRRTRAPALLFEVCFISNGCQFNNIITSGDQALIADGIAAGVSGYLGESLQKSKQPSQVISSTQVLSKPTPKIRVESLQEDFEGTTFPPTGWEIQTEGLGIPYEWHRTTDSIYVNSGRGQLLSEVNHQMKSTNG